MAGVLYNLLNNLSAMFGLGVIKPTINLVIIKKGSKVGKTFIAQTLTAVKQLVE